MDFNSRLAELSSLEDDWDSYGGEAPHPDAIRHTRELLEHCFLVPENDGGVYIEFHDLAGRITIEVDKDGIKSLYHNLGSATHLIQRNDEMEFLCEKER